MTSDGTLSGKQFPHKEHDPGSCESCGKKLTSSSSEDCLNNPFGPDHIPENGWYPRR